MSKLLRRAVPIFVIAATVGAAFAATGASGSSSRCVLTAKMTLIKGSFGAGNVSYRLTLGNSGSGFCTGSTTPGLHLHGRNGAGLPTNVKYSGRSTRLTIGRGADVLSASEKLRFSPDIPGPGEPTRGACEPKAFKIHVNFGSASAVGAVSPPTSVCEHGTMRSSGL
jgi:hypothetical protein